jgi:hypothetical protein
VCHNEWMSCTKFSSSYKSMCQISFQCMIIMCEMYELQMKWCLIFNSLSHFMVHGLFRCICGQPIHLTRIHLFCCVHGGGHVATHDVVWDLFASIARDAKFHVLPKQTHVLLVPSFHSWLWWWVDIVFTTNGICILAKSNHC